MLNLQKKYNISLCAVCALSVLCVILSAALFAGRTAAEKDGTPLKTPAMAANAFDDGEDAVPAVSQQESADAASGALDPADAASGPMYLVQAVGDEVRVIPYGRPDDYRVIAGIDVRTLRQVDQKALKDGLELFSEQELASFLEDFGS